jgi:2-polyprenyl-3-methyl-5-hydroxy-6-metoxy-1,4-benzoquinol methylase
MDFDAVYSRAAALYYPHASAWIATLTSELSAGRALDIGCGDGRNALHLLHEGWTVDAVDVAASGLTKLTTHAQAYGMSAGLHVFARDALAFLTDTDGDYDMVVASTILDHLPAALTQDTAEAIWRVLRPGGVLYASAFMVRDAASTPGSRLRGPTAFGVRRLFHRGELAALFPLAVVQRYVESVEQDLTHGPPHWHRIARFVGEKLIES